MIQFGLRLHDAEKLPIEQVLPLVRQKGFSCVHLALSKSLKVHIFHVQQVDGVEQDLQVRAADLVQHGAGASGIVHDVLDHRLNGNGHAVLLGTAHHRLEVPDKSSKGFVAAALRTEFVLRVPMWL